MNPTSLAAPLAGAPGRPALYSIMPGLMFVLLLLAFGGRYFLAIPQRPFPWYVHVHALLFTGWVGLVFIQATLIRAGAARTHRKLGLGGMVLAVVMVGLGIYSAIEGARRGHNPARFKDALSFLAVGLTDITLFALFMAAAWWARRRPEMHKRFVLLAMLGGFGWPTVTRLPMIIGIFPAMLGVLAVLVLIPPLVNGITQRRFDWLGMAGGLVILLSIPLRRVLGESESWHHVARWLVS